MKGKLQGAKGNSPPPTKPLTKKPPMKAKKGGRTMTHGGGKYAS